jgi:Ti-type conjugative transfer relaxase TraA
MLSIGNGKAFYYAELAQRDDYYQQGAEPPGVWHGDGAKEFDLSGEVEKQDFYALTSGFDRRTDQKLVRNAGTDKRRALWDFTFSAPKGASVWWAMTDEKTRERISASHLRAVTKTLDYIEEKGLIGTRRGASGRETDPCRKLVWAVYEHSTSRAQDAELHSHAVLINVGFNPDGETRTLDPKKAYEQKMLLGVMYRAEFSRELQREFGVEVERLPKGMFDIKGVPEELKAEHSTRRRQIVAAMEQEGAKGAIAAATFVLTTRERKQHRPRVELFQEWAERGKEYGLNEQEIAGRRAFVQPTHDQAKGMIKGVVTELTKDKAYFTEASLLKGLAIEAQYTGAGFALCQAVAAEYLEKEAIYLRTEKEQRLYTTPEIDQMEKRMLSQVIEGREKEFPAIRSRGEIDLSGLSEEQRRAIEYLMDPRGSVKVVNGMAGAGKTTMLRMAREGWEAQGFTVRGAALSSVAARGLETEAGITSQNIAQLITGIDNPERATGPALDSKTVLVIDEAGMVGTLQMARLVDEAQKAGARIALVGDTGQLQPIEHGAPFKVFGQMLDRSELKEIRRQRDEWQREAVHDFAGGRAVEGLTKYHERGLLNVTEKRTDAMRQLVGDWSQDEGPYKDKVMIGSTKAAVGALNRLGQQARMERGELGAESVQVNGDDFHAGDRILFRRNDRRLKVLNGERGTVQLIDPKSETIVARMDGGDLRVIPLSRYGHIQLGYAFTAHSLQGDTRESSYVLVGGAMQDKELSYVQMSRHRGEARIYAATEDVGKTLETMGEIMNRSRQKELAQEKRAEGLQIAPASDSVQNRPKLEEITEEKAKRGAEQQQRQAVPAEPWLASLLREDRTNVREAVRALEQIAGVSEGMRHNPSNEQRSSDIAAWVKYGQPIAEKLSVIPGLPLDAEIKRTLAQAFNSLHSLTRAYEYGQIPRGYAFQSTNIAREALSKVQSDLSTWELARSVSRSIGNFDAIAKTIEQGGRVGKLWQYGEPGEHNISVFTIRNLPGTFTAHAGGIDRTSMSFDDRINSFGYGDPPDSKKVKEIEYDPIKIRAEQIEQQRAQARQMERSQEQSRDGKDYGYSR